MHPKAQDLHENNRASSELEILWDRKGGGTFSILTNLLALNQEIT